jgi:hypothetical protein
LIVTGSEVPTFEEDVKQDIIKGVHALKKMANEVIDILEYPDLTVRNPQHRFSNINTKMPVPLLAWDSEGYVLVVFDGVFDEIVYTIRSFMNYRVTFKRGGSSHTVWTALPHVAAMLYHPGFYSAAKEQVEIASRSYKMAAYLGELAYADYRNGGRNLKKEIEEMSEVDPRVREMAERVKPVKPIVRRAGIVIGKNEVVYIGIDLARDNHYIEHGGYRVKACLPGRECLGGVSLEDLLLVVYVFRRLPDVARTIKYYNTMVKYTITRLRAGLF